MPTHDDAPDGPPGRPGLVDGSYSAFETETGELVIYDRRDHAGFVVSDSWTRVRP